MSVKTLRTEDGFTFRDLNKNGRLDPYEDPRRPIEERDRRAGIHHRDEALETGHAIAARRTERRERAGRLLHEVVAQVVTGQNLRPITRLQLFVARHAVQSCGPAS